MALMVIGCGEKGHDGGSKYPVSDAAFNKQNVWCEAGGVVVDTPECDAYYLSVFQNNLVEYYGGTVGLFSACDSNPYLCRDLYAMEDLIKNIRGY